MELCGFLRQSSMMANFMSSSSTTIHSPPSDPRTTSRLAAVQRRFWALLLVFRRGKLEWIVQRFSDHSNPLLSSSLGRWYCLLFGLRCGRANRQSLVCVFPRWHELGARYACPECRFVLRTFGTRLQRRALCFPPGLQWQWTALVLSFRWRRLGVRHASYNGRHGCSPSAVAWEGGITVSHEGNIGNNGNQGDGNLWFTYPPDGVNWGTDTQVENVGVGSTPSAVVI